MAKYKYYDYSQKKLIPVSLQEQLVPGTLEFAIHTLVEEKIDTSIFEERYRNDETGRLAYDPKVLLKLVLFGYSRGLISSRKIERACKENVTFMALGCGQQPDHSTIANFVSSMKVEIAPLFRDVLLICHEMDLLGGTFFALDGCKLPSNASKDWSGKHADLHRKKEKIERKVDQLITEQVDTDKDDDQGGGSSGFSDRKGQIDKLKRKADRIEKFLKENEPKIGRTGKEIKSNITDNESANMMTSHGAIQGYNGQALVDRDHQVIVHAEASGEGQDHHHIPPMLDGAKQNMEEIGQGGDYFEDTVLVADVNYHGPANLNKCEEEHVDAYIPDINFRKRDPRFSTQPRWSSKKSKYFILEDFLHNEKTDEYVCPNGKILKRNIKRMVQDGIISRRYMANKADCSTCQLRFQCLSKKKSRRRSLNVPIGWVEGNLTKKMAEKIDTKEGRNRYHQRIAIVEPVFANIRHMKRLNRFTLRGKVKVNIQWVLYCMVHNLEKITNYGFT
ncbi:IS1182 family transposase [Thermodesulfobacteriota bacterium]